MKINLRETTILLNNDLDVIKASTIGTERTLIFDMIRKIKVDIINGDNLSTPIDLCDLIIYRIQDEVHRKDFD
jgi:hypothetical protein